MKKIKYITLAVLLVLLFTIGGLAVAGKFENLTLKSTDLSNDGINGIHLNDTFSTEQLENKLGKITRKAEVAATEEEDYEEEGYTLYEFASTSSSIGDVRVKNDKIVEINVQDFGNNFKTQKGITFDSSFEDVVKAYGNNYKKTKEKVMMASTDYYVVTYVDKVNKTYLRFDFVEAEGKSKLNFIRFKVK